MDVGEVCVDVGLMYGGTLQNDEGRTDAVTWAPSTCYVYLMQKRMEKIVRCVTWWFVDGRRLRAAQERSGNAGRWLPACSCLLCRDDRRWTVAGLATFRAPTPRGVHTPEGLEG